MTAEPTSEREARARILESIARYCAEFHGRRAPFAPGERLPYAGRVYDHEDMAMLAESVLDFWLTAGRFAADFEKEFAAFLGVKHCALVNSGSSANLLAFMALTSPFLEERAVRPGDEVITVASGFPTTVAPIVQYGAVPVFVDVTIPQYNLDVSLLEAARSDRTRAVMAAHTLGNPFDLAAVKGFCEKHGLWLIEDNCDALGSIYTLDNETALTGSLGDIGTSSFYPPHHMTMGEGGAVYTSNPLLAKILFSLRDWGRDCVCPSGRDNLCGHRFSRQYGELPPGYDHKYVYSHFGYNLKATDMQAALGLAQLKKLPGFAAARRKNFALLRVLLRDCEDRLILPEACPDSDPSWFGFALTCREGGRRDDLVAFLERKGIQTRMLFAGNIVRQPCFDGMRAAGAGYRQVGGLKNSDRIMRDTFWIGVYPGLDPDRLEYMAKAVREALEICS